MTEGGNWGDISRTTPSQINMKEGVYEETREKRPGLLWRTSPMCCHKSYTKLDVLSDTLKLYFYTTLTVEVLAGVIFIAPALLLILCITLQVNHAPLGAILFWSVFIPLVIAKAVMDKLRMKELKK